jgi:hypothetical protein
VACEAVERARSSVSSCILMAFCRAPTCLPTDFQHPVSGAQNGADREFQRIPINFSICIATIDLGATGVVTEGLQVSH